MQPPQTLTWINERVARGRDRILEYQAQLETLLSEFDDSPPSKDGYDYKSAISVARTNLEFEENQHFKWIAKQQLFDKSVDQSKRDNTESITRKEGERLFSMFAIYMRTASGALITRLIPDIRESKSNEDAFELLERDFNECFLNSINSAVQNQHLPEWAKAAFEEVL